MAALPALAQIQTVEVEPVTTGAPGPDSTYSAGQTLAVRFGYRDTLPADISQAGIRAHLNVGEGASARRQTDACVGDGRFLICSYTVGPTDEDANGVSVPDNADGARTIDDPNAMLVTTEMPQGYEESDLPNHKVDGVSVDLIGFEVQVQPRLARTGYRVGDVVRARVTFSDDVAAFGEFAPMLVSGRPMVPVASAANVRTYTHVVAPGEDAARLAVVDLWRPNDVVDGTGNRGIHETRNEVPLGVPRTSFPVTYTQGVTSQSIDTVPPSVTGTRLLGAQSLLGGGDDVDVVVAFDERVWVEAPAGLLLRLEVGTDVKRIGLRAGAPSQDTDELTFRWPAADVQKAPVEGRLRVPAQALVVGAGAAVADAVGNPAGNTSAARDLDAHVDSRPPQVRDIRGRAPATVAEGSVVHFDVTFDEEIEVAWPTMLANETCALPKLGYTLYEVGVDANGVSGEACYVGIRGRTATLASALPALPDGNGDIELKIDELTTHGATKDNGVVMDTAGNVPAAYSPTEREVLKRAAAPTVGSGPPVAQSLVMDKDLYAKDDSLRFSLAFDRPTSGLATRPDWIDFAIDGCPTGAAGVPVGRFAVVFTYSPQSDRQPRCANRSGRITWGAEPFRAGGETGSKVDIKAPAGAGSARVDTVAPRVTDVTIESRPRATLPGGSAMDLYYGEGDLIDVAVTLDEPVQVGCSRVNIKMGAGNDRYAAYVSGNGSARLRFSYRVGSGDVDADGVSVEGFAVCTPAVGRMVTDAAGNPVAVSFGHHAIHDDGAHPVNGALRFVDAPPADGGDAVDDSTDDRGAGDDSGGTGATGRLTLASSGSGTDGSFRSGDAIVVRGEFSAPGVDVVTPLRLEFDIGGDTRLVTCTGVGRGRTSVECRYRVAPGDEARDGVFVRIASGTIRAGDVDVVPDITELDPPALVVDARAPTLRSVDWNTDPGGDETYVTGDAIGVEITFSEPVRARGEISLPLRVGRSLRRAALTSPAQGEPAIRFVFRYTVAAGDEDSDGVAVPALGPGSLIGELQDAAGHAAEFAHREVTDDPLHIVDTLGPEVTDIEPVARPSSGAYGAGTVLTVVVTFNEPVVVAAAGAELTLTLGNATRDAGYVAGAGTERLTFAYDVRAGDDGAVGVPVDAVRGVTDIGGNPVRGNAAVVFDVAVDTAVPGISAAPRLASAPESGVYGVGDEVVVVVAFSERVQVIVGDTGPNLRIGIGGAERFAAYAGGGGTSELRFVYVVAAGDQGDRVSVAADALALGDGAVRDAHDIDAVLRHAAMPATDGHRVDGVAPVVEGAAIVSLPKDGVAYGVEEAIEVEVAFGEPVLWAEGAVLRLGVGKHERRAECAAPSNEARDALTCSYTVALGDFDDDGVAVVADSLVGAFEDLAGNRAALALPEVADDPRHRVHAAPPELVRSLDTIEMIVGGDSRNVDLAGVFRGLLTQIVAVSDDERVVSVSVSDSTLMLRPGTEGMATVTVTASNRAGEVETTFAVKVMTDPAETAVLNDAMAAIGRGVLTGTSELIGARFRLAGDVSSLSLGGRRFTAASAGALHDGHQVELRRLPFRDAGPPRDVRRQSLALAGSGFDMRLASRSQGVRWSLWGGADQYSLGGEDEYDGTGVSAALGVDARGETVLAGVALVRSSADADYSFAGETEGSGTLETTFTGVHPYLRLAMSEDTELWALAGFGSGEATVWREHVGRTELTDLTMAMGAAGLRRALAIDFAGVAFSLHGDAAFLSITSEDGEHTLDGVALGVSRLRLGVEGAWQLGAGAVSPFASVGARFDGGDSTGDSTGGVELAGGVRVGDVRSPFGLEARARVLALPFGEGSTDSGISLTASIDPGQLGRGFWLRLSPRWGADTLATDPFGHASAWEDARGRGLSGGTRGWGVDASFGYALPFQRIPGLLTPFVEMASAAGPRRLRGGVRYRGDARVGNARVEFFVERIGDPRPEARVMVRASARL